MGGRGETRRHHPNQRGRSVSESVALSEVLPVRVEKRLTQRARRIPVGVGGVERSLLIDLRPLRLDGVPHGPCPFAAVANANRRGPAPEIHLECRDSDGLAGVLAGVQKVNHFLIHARTLSGVAA